ncbi:MAG: ABC transporter permease subunit [Ruminococcaceae bacterium]|nr:ABC transporter permease subunit [Oscillospiraceae bacterium]
MDATKLLLSAVFIVLVFYPFLQMVIMIQPEDFGRVVTASNFPEAVANSLRAAVTTTAISVSLGMALAACLQRTNIRGKAVLSVVLILPMLIPSISHGMGLIVVFGTNGILTNLLGLEGTIYGFGGMVLGSVLYSYPVAFLMLNDVLKYQDSSPYEAAAVLGIPPLRRMTAITLPYLARPLVSAVFAVFTMVITDYGIPLMIGGKNTTLAVMMYQEVLGQVDFGKGSVVGLFLLIPAIITFVFNTLSKNRAKMGYVTRPFEMKRNSLRDGAAYVFCGAVLLFVVVLIGSFCMLAFTTRYPSDLTFTLAHVQKMLDLGGDRYVTNSVIIALFVSVIGIVTAFVTAYMTTRVPSRMSHFLHLCSITSLAIPGIVLGLSYALTFSRSFIYGTMAILIMANLMHFFASPYLMMYNSLSKMNENLESVGATLGISRLRIVLHVIIPQSKSTLLEMFSYFFVNSMMTISAVSFLANVRTKPLSLMINQFEAQMLMECAAVVSLCILLVNVCIKGMVYLINQHVSKRPPVNPAR